MRLVDLPLVMLSKAIAMDSGHCHGQRFGWTIERQCKSRGDVVEGHGHGRVAHSCGFGLWAYYDRLCLSLLWGSPYLLKITASVVIYWLALWSTSSTTIGVFFLPTIIRGWRVLILKGLNHKQGMDIDHVLDLIGDSVDEVSKCLLLVLS